VTGAAVFLFNGVVERIRRGAAAYDALAGLPV